MSQSRNLWIQESYINATRGHGIGESDIYETDHETVGDLFRDLQREFGRCAGKVYVDTLSGKTKHVGWVFRGMDNYSDSNEKYLRETWIHVYSGPPVNGIVKSAYLGDR